MLEEEANENEEDSEVIELSKPCVRKEIHKFKGEHLLSAFFNLKQLIGCLIQLTGLKVVNAFTDIFLYCYLL